jgi:hypothetical protein
MIRAQAAFTSLRLGLVTQTAAPWPFSAGRV